MVVGVCVGGCVGVGVGVYVCVPARDGRRRREARSGGSLMCSKAGRARLEFASMRVLAYQLLLTCIMVFRANR